MANKNPLRGRSLLSLRDYSAAEITLLLDCADALKAEKLRGEFPRRLAHKNFALIFQKPSCRTRAAFAVAAADEGANCEVLSAAELRFGQKESVKDIARVLGRYFHGIVFRGFEHALACELARWAGVPVWNALTDEYHPTQALADFQTLREVFGELRGLRVCYCGDGRNNQATSLMFAAAKLGAELHVLAPVSLQPKAELVRQVLHGAAEGAAIRVGAEPQEMLEGAAAVYGDVWVSMGEEARIAERARALRGYQVTRELMALSGRRDTVYMHCLPALHGPDTEFARAHPELCEVADDVFEGPQSRVFDQAENRMHTAKAVMVQSCGNWKH